MKRFIEILRAYYPLIAFGSFIIALISFCLSFIFGGSQNGELSIEVNKVFFKDFEHYSTHHIIEYQKVIIEKDSIPVKIELPVIENSSSSSLRECELTINYIDTDYFKPVSNYLFNLSEASLIFEGQIKAHKRIPVEFFFYPSNNKLYHFHCNYTILYELSDSSVRFSYDLYLKDDRSDKKYWLDSISIPNADLNFLPDVYHNKNLILAYEDTAMYVSSELFKATNDKKPLPKTDYYIWPQKSRNGWLFKMIITFFIFLILIGVIDLSFAIYIVIKQHKKGRLFTVEQAHMIAYFTFATLTISYLMYLLLMI